MSDMSDEDLTFEDSYRDSGMLSNIFFYCTRSCQSFYNYTFSKEKSENFAAQVKLYDFNNLVPFFFYL
jgi:hypothetical protein